MLKDEYFECINVTQSDWNGKYCFIGPSAVTATKETSFKFGICMPRKCINQDIAKLMNSGIFFYWKVIDL